MQDTTNFRISSIVEDFLKQFDFKKKNDVLVLLMKLKESLEFNATIDWQSIYKELGEVYRDHTPYYQSSDYTPEYITEDIGPNGVFVFGSNYQGVAGGGAAREAVKKYGAPETGLIRGLVNRSYGIPTKDMDKGQRSCDFTQFENDINEFLEFAASNPEKTFWLTKIGCGLSGYHETEIAPYFANKVIPANVKMPIEFVHQIYLNEYLYSESKNKFFRVKDDVLYVLTPEEPSVNTIQDKAYRMYLPKDCQICSQDDFDTALSYILDKIKNI